MLNLQSTYQIHIKMKLIELEEMLIFQILPVIQDRETICIEQHFNKNVSSVFSLYYKRDLTKQQIDISPEIISLVMKVFRPVFLDPEFYGISNWNTVILEINMDGTYKSQYLFDTKKIKDDELITSQDFSASMTNHLVNHYLFANVKFKRKFERIIWIFWIKDELPYFELCSINKKNQKLSIKLDDEYTSYTKKALLHHYEATNNGILKDVWKPWNKIVTRIPPNGYLDEKEDIDYYLDDVLLSKDFFLRGY